MIRVLLVDDHAPFRRVVETLLRLHPDIEVCGSAEDGEQALVLCRSTAPDVVVMDVAMPVLDGLGATREIRRLGLPGRVLIFSADSRGVAAGREAGAVAALVKGCPPEELVAVIRAMADRTDPVSSVQEPHKP